VSVTALTRRLPDGFVARLRPDLLRNTGDLLVGGSPLRALRLSDRAQSCVTGDRVVVRDRASSEVAARLLDDNLADPEPPDLATPATELTVVVPVRDRPEQLDRCLAALAPLACIVVDDASRDRSAVAAVVAAHGATLLPLDHNLGPAGARNLGLARVRTPYVAFVDSDVVVTADTLLGLARQFADPEVALVGPLVKGVSRSARPRWFERYDAAASSLDLGLRGARVRPGSSVAWLPSACLVGRVDVLRGVGGFDAKMRVGEDVDLVWRLVGSGVVVRYDPTHVAEHDTRSTVRDWCGRKFLYGTGGAALARNHGDWTAPAILSPTAAIGAAALLARRRWSLPVAGAAATLSARRLRRELPSATRRGVPLSVDVAARGIGWAVRQESALLLRHWWPATAAASLISPSIRRMVATALAVDLVVATREHLQVGFVHALVGRRLDDLAYGAGLWCGAIRARSARGLLPRRVGQPRTSPDGLLVGS
jgi:mycofactocin system glycosyltransferase